MNIDLPNHLINNIIQYKEYSIILTNIDVDINMNKYFNIILFKHKVINTYFLVSSYGRLGRSISDQKVKCIVNNEEAAINDFKSLFYDKTGIKWDCRLISNPINNKYSWINQDITEDDVNDNQIIIENWLTNFIIDISTKCKQYRTIKNLDIPISKSNINLAYNILNEIKKLISNLDSSNLDESNLDESKLNDKLKALSNKFYSIVPTSDSVIKILNNNDIIKEKLEMLEFYELNGNINMFTSPIPKLISIFKYNISLINFNSDIGKIIINYFYNGLGSQHKKIINIYGLNEKTNSNFSSSNIYLFWHGTKHHYLQSILTNSLILPNSNIRHLMFGPGIYFANASCKSLSYSDKYMLLCEVDLGNTLVMYNSHNSLIINKPYDSVTAYGKQSFSEYEKLNIDTLTDVNIPKNKLIYVNYQTAQLNFDEFIVYDTSRIKIKYILEWK